MHHISGIHARLISRILSSLIGFVDAHLDTLLDAQPDTHLGKVCESFFFRTTSANTAGYTARYTAGRTAGYAAGCTAGYTASKSARMRWSGNPHAKVGILHVRLDVAWLVFTWHGLTLLDSTRSAKFHRIPHSVDFDEDHVIVWGIHENKTGSNIRVLGGVGIHIR